MDREYFFSKECLLERIYDLVGSCKSFTVEAGFFCEGDKCSEGDKKRTVCYLLEWEE